MPIETYDKNPALRPTILAKDVLKNVYRPSREIALPAGRTAKPEVARETPRAA